MNVFIQLPKISLSSRKQMHISRNIVPYTQKAPCNSIYGVLEIALVLDWLTYFLKRFMKFLHSYHSLFICSQTNRSGMLASLNTFSAYMADNDLKGLSWHIFWDSVIVDDSACITQMQQRIIKV